MNGSFHVIAAENDWIFSIVVYGQPYLFNSGYVSGIPDLKRTHRLAWLT